MSGIGLLTVRPPRDYLIEKCNGGNTRRRAVNLDSRLGNAHLEEPLFEIPRQEV